MSDLHRDDWTLEELFEHMRDAHANELHTATPARVDSYDVATQTATVTPMLKRTLPTEDGDTVSEALPSIHAVPVVFFRAGGYYIHSALAEGDTVLLIVLERDPSRWLQTGEVSETLDVRMHHLAHAVAIAGLFPNGERLSGLSNDSLELGRVGGPIVKITSSEVQAGGAVALAEHPNLDAHLAKIAQDLTAIANAAGTTAANYGTPAKVELDGTHPIATTITKGT